MKNLLAVIVTAGFMFGIPSSLAEVDGEKLMKQTCLSCHNFDSASRPKTGPNLGGVAGSKAGTQENFKRGTKTAYSTGMQKIAETGLVWTDENLKAYLTNPSGFLKEKSGDSSARSTMVFRKLSDEEVAAIVEHLKTLQ